MDRYDPWLSRLTTKNGIDVYYTTRGDSVKVLDPYSGFNVCNYTGDDLNHVAYCRKLLADKLYVPKSSIIIPYQIHSTNVLLLESVPVDDNKLDGIDGVVTKLKDVVIGVSTADCVPVVLYDNVSGIVGVAHAGWRGAINGIVENTVKLMVDAGAKIEEICVEFGPSICVNCFEVGEEVASVFPEECVERKKYWNKPHVNLHRYIKRTLVQLGLQAMNIKDFQNDLCTKCHPERFFSARVLGIKSGRIFTFVRT